MLEDHTQMAFLTALRANNPLIDRRPRSALCSSNASAPFPSPMAI
jgi:hypothetical protein